MVRTIAIGGHESLLAVIDTVLAGATPNIVQVIESQKGYWIILHTV